MADEVVWQPSPPLVINLITITQGTKQIVQSVSIKHPTSVTSVKLYKYYEFVEEKYSTSSNNKNKLIIPVKDYFKTRPMLSTHYK